MTINNRNSFQFYQTALFCFVAMYGILVALGSNPNFPTALKTNSWMPYLFDKPVGEDENTQLDTVSEPDEDESDESNSKYRDEVINRLENEERDVMPDDDGEDGGEMEQ